MTAAADTWSAPIVCPSQRVEKDWIDYNGHLNLAFYHVLFDRAVDHVYDTLGIGAAYAEHGGGSCFTVEVHVSYLSELLLDDPVRITFQLLDHDAKRLHYYLEMFHGERNELTATSEHLAVHVAMESRRSAAFPAEKLHAIEALAAAHGPLPMPERVGRRMGIRR